MMKNILTSILLLISIQTFAQNSGTLILEIQGVQAAKGGKLSAGIFDRENFPKIGKAYRVEIKSVEGNSMRIIFMGIPPNEYGVAVYQDIDQNNDLKTNLIGLPREPIGFSNDAKINFGPPSFEDAKVIIKAGETLTIPIILR